MSSLENKIAVVTGASSGIGRATALLFAREGASVVVGARREPELEALVAEIRDAGGRAAHLAGDVKDESYAKALVETARGEFGGLDIGFNNAGTLGPHSPVTELSLAEWTETIDTNLTSGFLGAKYQVPAMIERGGGSLIFTSSFVGNTVVFPGKAAYSASKAGLTGLVKVLAVEYGPQGIRANALLPGGTETEMYRTDVPEEARPTVEGLKALKRVATPEEMARSVLYLASDASTFTTGTSMLVEGGISVNRV